MAPSNAPAEGTPAAAELEAPAAAGSSVLAAAALGGPRADPGSSSGGGLGGGPAPVVGVDAWLDGLGRIASFPAALQVMAEMLHTVTLPSG